MSVKQRRKRPRAVDEHSVNSFLADLQTTDPFEDRDIDFIASQLRGERTGWVHPHAEDRVTLQVSTTVSASFSTREVVVGFLRGFNDLVSTSPRSDKFASSLHELMARRPDLSESDARTVRLKLHASIVHILASEAARAFEHLVPQLLSLAVSIAVAAAEPIAEEAACRYQPQDIRTGERIRFEFPKEKKAEWREGILRDAESSIRKILGKLKSAPGAKGTATRDLQAFQRREAVFAHEKANGKSDRLAWTAAKAVVQAEFPKLRKEATYETAMRRGKRIAAPKK